MWSTYLDERARLTAAAESNFSRLVWGALASESSHLGSFYLISPLFSFLVEQKVL